MNTQARRPDSKLGSAAVRSLITDLAESGATLSEIRTRLARPNPDGFGIEVSRVSIFKRLKAAGIKLKSESISARSLPIFMSPEALAVSRRAVSKESLARHKNPKPGRLESWLQQFSKEIDELDQDGYTYRGIWGVMAERYPMVPQFSAPLTDKQKTDRLAVFVLRQRKKSETGTASKGRSLITPTPHPNTSPIPGDTPVPTQIALSPVLESDSRPARTRASLPTVPLNIGERKRAYEAEGSASRTNLSAEQLDAVHRQHGLPPKKA